MNYAPTPIRPEKALKALVGAALTRALGEGYENTDLLLAPSKSKTHDLQANFVMKLAKELSMNPRELATQVVDSVIDEDNILADVEVAGPGFINFRLGDNWLAFAGQSLLETGKLVDQSPKPKNIVIDYSGPNVAKEMHVGHLRSTIIGDALSRVLSTLGHTVIPQNHLGDWGTQFGMLTQHMIDQGMTDAIDFESLGKLYRDAKARFDTDADFKEAARARVVALQSGDAHTVALWTNLVEVSVNHIQELYTQLGVLLTPDDIKGESFYNDKLGSSVELMQKLGIAKVDDGAVVIDSDKFQNPDGSPAVLIIKKSNGSFGYGATDLAAFLHRADDLHAERIIYVTDSRQGQHFTMLFDAIAKTGKYAHVKLDHVPFGTMLGEDGKPFKTRSGDTVKLSDLLNEAVAHALTRVQEKSPEISEDEQKNIAKMIGIGAVKYNDLATSRQRDIMFSSEKALSLEGNTSSYIAYASVRAAHVVKKSGLTDCELTTIETEQEHKLIMRLLEFSAVVERVGATSEPHHLSTYLFTLAGDYTSFYEACPVLSSQGDTLSSRIALCVLTSKVLKSGLNLLGIDVPERM